MACVRAASHQTRVDARGSASLALATRDCAYRTPRVAPRGAYALAQYALRGAGRDAVPIAAAHDIAHARQTRLQRTPGDATSRGISIVPHRRRSSLRHARWRRIVDNIIIIRCAAYGGSGARDITAPAMRSSCARRNRAWPQALSKMRMTQRKTA